MTKNDPIKALEEHVADRRRELEEAEASGMLESGHEDRLAEAELCLDIARESW